MRGTARFHFFRGTIHGQRGSIGRGLREQYDPAQPFSERLARLVGKIERSTREWNTEKGRKNGPI
jgi:hypothetical protein